MYSLVKKVAILASDIEQILNREFVTPRRGQLLRDYLRLRLKASLNRWFHFTHEHFLSYRVGFPDYEIFFAEFRQIFVRHAYYPGTLRSPTPTIVDCGGNIGMSVLYFKYLYPKAHITVFEPSREVIPSLENNLRLNKLTDVTVVQKAVTASDGEVTMYARGAAACGNTLLVTLVRDDGKSSGEHYTVSATRLSTFITKPVDFLKLDIEGSEGLVIKELHQSGTLGNIGNVVMEYHDTGSEDNSLSALIHTLEVCGWKVEPFSEDPLTSYVLSLRTKKQSA